MSRTFPLLIASCFVALVVVVGWGSSVGAWSTGAGGDPNWGSTTFGGTITDRAYAVAVDGSGNVYTTGAFSGTVDFGAGNVTAADRFDVFVTKLNSSGVHQWTTTFGGTNNAFGFGVAVDGSGNVHVTTKIFDTETLNGRLIDVTPAGTGLCALGADGGLFDMLGATHNTVLRAHTNPNTTAIDTTG